MCVCVCLFWILQGKVVDIRQAIQYWKNRPWTWDNGTVLNSSSYLVELKSFLAVNVYKMYIFFVLLFLSLLCVKLILDVDIFTPSILSEEKKNRHENRNCMKSKTDKDKQSIFLNCLGKFPPLRRHHLKKKIIHFQLWIMVSVCHIHKGHMLVPYHVVYLLSSAVFQSWRNTVASAHRSPRGFCYHFCVWAL